MYFDQNFVTSNVFQTNEFVVQSENQVLGALQALSGYSKPENVPDVNLKKQYGLTAWTRPTFKWSLECESQVSREQAMRFYQLKFQSNFQLKLAAGAGIAMTAVMAFLYVIAWFEFCCRKIFYFSFAVSRLVIVICLSAIISKVYFAQRTINSNYGLVQQYNWAYER